jgi:NADH-quinone oxidoreductase subunit E
VTYFEGYGSMVAELSEVTVEKVDDFLTRYAVKQGALLPILHAIQDDQGQLTLDSIEWAAGKCQISPATAYGVATFYPMFRMEPVGTHHLEVCSTAPCGFCGGRELIDALKAKLGVNTGEITPDGKFSIGKSECLAACHEAPAVQVNKKVYRYVTADKVDEFLAAVESGEKGQFDRKDQ